MFGEPKPYGDFQGEAGPELEETVARKPRSCCCDVS